MRLNAAEDSRREHKDCERGCHQPQPSRSCCPLTPTPLPSAADVTAHRPRKLPNFGSRLNAPGSTKRLLAFRRFRVDGLGEERRGHRLGWRLIVLDARSASQDDRPTALLRTHLEHRTQKRGQPGCSVIETTVPGIPHRNTAPRHLPADNPSNEKSNDLPSRCAGGQTAHSRKRDRLNADGHRHPSSWG